MKDYFDLAEFNRGFEEQLQKEADLGSNLSGATSAITSTASALGANPLGPVSHIVGSGLDAMHQGWDKLTKEDPGAPKVTSIPQALAHPVNAYHQVNHLISNAQQGNAAFETSVKPFINTDAQGKTSLDAIGMAGNQIQQKAAPYMQQIQPYIDNFRSAIAPAAGWAGDQINGLGMGNGVGDWVKSHPIGSLLGAVGTAGLGAWGASKLMGGDDNQQQAGHPRNDGYYRGPQAPQAFEKASEDLFKTTNATMPTPQAPTPSPVVTDPRIQQLVQNNPAARQYIANLLAQPR